jgi:SAM-dependent methyltransferase
VYDEQSERWIEMKRNGKNINHIYLEKPAMKNKISDLGGKDVLCLGVGSGEEIELLREFHPKSIVGTDLSSKLIESAQLSFPEYEFYACDMENQPLINNSVDFVYSSLVMHYKKSWEATFKEIYRILRPGGIFLFSTHHPVRWSAYQSKIKGHNKRILGYDKLKDKEPIIYGDYLNNTKLTDVWFGDFEVEYYHKPFGEIIPEIIKSKFVIADFVEPKPTKQFESIDPKAYKVNNKIPLFMIFELIKQS